MTRGKIYILRNEVMPGLVKIGITTNSIEQRMRELDTTGVPYPFTAHYAVEVENYDIAEKLIHSQFDDFRVRPNREFFKIDPERAVSALKLAMLNDSSAKELIFSEETIGEDGAVSERESKKIRRPQAKLDKLGISNGSILKFVRDEEIQAAVRDNEHNLLEFENQDYTMSRLAGKILKEKYGWSSENTAQGPLYWTYEGDTINEIWERQFETENEENT